MFDLTERVEDIKPLPGFARLRTRTRTDNSGEVLFVPLLGFEGSRLSRVLEELKPAIEDVLPVLGVPGFRAEFPFFSLVGNRRPLDDTRAWPRIRYAAAASPFDVAQLLLSLRRAYPQRLLNIAILGTKPHAVGAVLFALKFDEDVELIYDYPKRRADCTEGESVTWLYDVSGWFRKT
jgi:hypothetical protein